jgi:hypothetical protein
MIEVPHLRGIEGDSTVFRAVHPHADLVVIYPFYRSYIAV